MDIRRLKTLHRRNLKRMSKTLKPVLLPGFVKSLFYDRDVDRITKDNSLTTAAKRAVEHE